MNTEEKTVHDTATQIVEAYFSAWTNGNYAKARSFLANDGFSFDGPLEQHDSADQFIESFAQLGPLTKSVEMREIVAKANAVATVYDFVYQLPDGSSGTTKTSEWLSIVDGKIAQIRIFFDPRPYAAFFGPH